jgi:hypothetical protein
VWSKIRFAIFCVPLIFSFGLFLLCAWLAGGEETYDKILNAIKEM